MQRGAVLCGAVKLHAILARIACAGYDAWDAGNLCFLHKRVILFGDRPFHARSLKHLHKFRALQRKLGVFSALVFHLHGWDGMRRKPFKILFRVACVDNHEVVRIAVLVNEHIVHRSAVLIADHGIPAAAGGHGCDVIGKHILQIRECTFTAYPQFAHMRNVKQPADCFVFFQNGGILHRQRPASEIDHLAAERNMHIIQGSFFQRIH